MTVRYSKVDLTLVLTKALLRSAALLDLSESQLAAALGVSESSMMVRGTVTLKSGSKQAELAKRTRTFASRPQVAIPTEAGGQPAAAIMAQYAGTKRRIEKNHRASPGTMLAFDAGNLPEPVLIRSAELCRVEEDRAMGGFLDLRLDHGLGGVGRLWAILASSAARPAWLRQVVTVCQR